MAQAEELVHRWFEDLFNQGNLSAIEEIVSQDIAYHGPASLSPKDVTGPNDIKRYVRVYREAFPDLTYTVDHVFRSGNELCVRWTVEGTHQTDLFGIDASGESFSESGIDIFLVEDGAITEVWSAWDTLRMAQELDIVSPVELLGT